MFVYVKQSSPKKKRKSVPKKLAQAVSDHAVFVKSMVTNKVIRDTQFAYNFPDLSVEHNVSATSDNLYTTGGFKRSVDDYKWRRNKSETKETIKEIERKKSQIAPAYNKGPVMYINSREEAKSIGRKV